MDIGGKLVSSVEEFVIPESMEEVLALLAANPKESRIIAGNTTFFELYSRGLAPDVKILVDITRAGLDSLEDKGDGLHIGSTVTLSELCESPLLTNDRFYRIIAETAREITPTQIRNVATVGGEICSGISFFDLPTTLLAIDAKVAIARKGGQRLLPLREFYTDYLTVALEPDEIVREVIIPRPRERSAGAFMKLGRTASDFALVNVATSISMDDSGICQAASLWMGGVGPTFHECKRSESKLVGSSLDEDVIRDAASAACDFDPIPSVHASTEYKKAVIPAIARNCLNGALRKLQER